MCMNICMYVTVLPRYLEACWTNIPSLIRSDLSGPTRAVSYREVLLFVVFVIRGSMYDVRTCVQQNLVSKNTVNE